MDDKDKRIKDLEDKVKLLEQKRVYRQDIAPDAVLQRHVGEGVRFIRDGTTDDLPAEGEEPSQGAAIYFDYETNELYVWNRDEGAYKSVTLS